jgi:hypothetical protein
MVSSATAALNSAMSYLPRRLGATTPMLLGAALAVLLVAAPAALAAPANDNLESAQAVSALPFSHEVDPAGRTTEEGEPQFCSSVDNSAWYAITPSEDAILSADASATWGLAQINVYRQDASGLGGLSFLACQSWSSEQVVFRVQAGSTYYLQASTLYSGSGQLRVDVDEVQAPANDNFGDATPISSVPFGDDLDLLGASAQPSEPTDCIGTDQKTAWYAFTPSETGSYAVERSGGHGYLPLAVYTGGSLSSLSQVACAGYSTAIFRAEAGKTYYLQLGHGYGSRSVHLSLDTAPPASASFYHYPSDPSIFDTVSFYDYSWDPAGIASSAWAFGDGATATGGSASHRYAADGDYPATLGITTTDGRSASATSQVHVKTHDVAMTKLTVPQSARVGQSRQLTVGLTNTRYADIVQVALMRSVAGGGFEQVGQVTQNVPTRTGGRTTTFSISYTFTPEDATLGKVTFQAIATILGARDAHAADNTVTALPTKVSS